jgi:hypothetical protein
VKVKLSGTVRYANGDPVSNVEVRIYDKDDSGKEDDDLTIAPGLSDELGHFEVTYEPLRYLDFHTLHLRDAPKEPFNTPSARPGLRLPDLGDIYLPYLQFSYTFNGINRQHTASIGFFQAEFHLPENPPVEFIPSVHGFKFVNRFPGYFLPFSMPDFLTPRKVAPKYGLCGGMCAAAYDIALAGRVIPQKVDVPHRGTRLQRYLFRRQMDSLGGMGQQVIKVAQWTSMPEDTLLGTQAQTALEFNQVRPKLDDENLVILALIYEHATSLRELSRLIFNNHQVMAYAYQQDFSGVVTINVYDPNLPARDDVVIQCEPVALGEVISLKGPQTVMGLKSVQLVGGELYQNVRGFFSMPYEPVEPPKRI